MVNRWLVVIDRVWALLAMVNNIRSSIAKHVQWQWSNVFFLLRGRMMVNKSSSLFTICKHPSQAWAKLGFWFWLCLFLQGKEGQCATYGCSHTYRYGHSFDAQRNEGTMDSQDSLCLAYWSLALVRESRHFSFPGLIFLSPDAPCMVCSPTFTFKITQV